MVWVKLGGAPIPGTIPRGAGIFQGNEFFSGRKLRDPRFRGLPKRRGLAQTPRSAYQRIYRRPPREPFSTANFARHAMSSPTTSLETRESLAAAIYDLSHLTGEFLLRSGVISNEYFDKYLFEANPAVLAAVAKAMTPLLPAGIDALAGLEMGGIPVATMISQESGLPTLFVRKRAKEYGTRKIAEGGAVAGRKLVIIEDVVTSGGQILLSAEELRNLGAEIDTVLCVIDRESGGREKLAEEGLELRPLFTMSELKAAAKLG
jgi:orotate phosphoribosyltransferase